MRFLVAIIFLIFPIFALSAHMDPVLKAVLDKNLNYIGKTVGSKYINEVKVLYKNGNIKVVPFDPAYIKDLLSDEDVLYLEASRKVKPLMEVVRNSAVAIVLSSSTSFTIKTRSGQRLVIKKFGTGTISLDGDCSGPITDMICSEGTLNVNISTTGELRLIVISQNFPIDLSDIQGVDAFYVGTSASISRKTGKGIIIGVIDTGINPCHPAFLNPDGTSRILFLYEPKTNLELDQAQINESINEGRCYYDSNGHGTHVAGIAAGGDRNSLYMGIAPDAELIIVRLIDFTDSEIIKGLDYLVNKYRSLGKPIVVNMSLGGHFGPHDGTGLLSRAVNNAVDNGLVVVVAAGNEADIALHAKVENFSADVVIPFQTYTSGGDVIDGWYKGGSMTVSLCKGSTCVSASPGTVVSSSILGCRVYIDNSIQSSPLNGDGEFYIDFYCGGSFEIKLSPQNGDSVDRVDLYFACPMCYSEFEDYVERDTLGGVLGTVGIPAVADKAITVGALTSLPIFGPTELNLKSFQDLGKIAYFSSRGPTRDGRLKPDIVAGGFFVYSASNDGFSYVPNAGTSMASPVVAGIAALIMEDLVKTYSYISKQLTPLEVKDIITRNYIVSDNSTLLLPNVTYGYGKVIVKNQQLEQAPNALSGGGGGCSSYSNKAYYIIIILILLLIRVKRRQI